MLKKSLLGSMLALALASEASAQTTTSTAPPASFHAKVIEVDGEAHVALPTDEMGYLKWLHQRRVPALERALRLQDELLGAQRARIKTATTALDLSISMTKTATAALLKIEEAADGLAEAQKTSWLNYVPPFLVGVATGIIIWELKK